MNIIEEGADGQLELGRAGRRTSAEETPVARTINISHHLVVIAPPPNINPTEMRSLVTLLLLYKLPLPTAGLACMLLRFQLSQIYGNAEPVSKPKRITFLLVVTLACKRG